MGEGMHGSDFRRPISIFTLAAELALWAAAFSCPLALGSASIWALWPLCVLSATAAITGAVGSLRSHRSIALPPFAAVLAVSAALCLLQLVPLPRPLLDWLSPRSAQLRDLALIPLGLPAARSISLDPPATWRELAKSISYLLLFFAAVQVSRSRSGARRRLTAAVALSGLAVALIGYAHALVGAHSLFGFYSYATPQPLFFLTTFGNPNHLSSLLTLTSTVALGLALTAADRQRAALWGLAYAASGAAIFFSLSRGGICFFIAAQAIFVFLLYRGRRSRISASPVSRLMPGRESGIILATLAVLSISAFVASERIVAELRTADSVEKLRESKIQMWPVIVKSARHFARSGMGGGAFEAAFTRDQTESPEVTFTHPENIVLQLCADLGLLGALLVGGIAAWALLRLLQRQESSTLDLAILSGLSAMVLHDLFDFSLALPGCAAVACIAMGIASRSENAILAEREGGAMRLAPGPLAAALALLALFSLVPGGETLQTAESELASRLAKAPTSEITAAAARAIDRHPADYLLYDLAGGAYDRSKPPRPGEALAFANRALFLRPLDVEAHRVAARALLKLGRRSQAALEYRLAYEAGQDGAATLDEAVPSTPELDELKLLVPTAPGPISEVVVRLWISGRKPQAEALLADALATLSAHPDAPELWLLEAQYSSERRDFARALDAAAQAERGWPGGIRPAISRANILWQMGQPANAVVLLEDVFARHPNDLELAFRLAQTLTLSQNSRRAREVLAIASPLVSSLAVRSRWLSAEGETFESDGQNVRALQSYQAAARVLPTEPANHYSVARVLEALKRPADAMAAVREGMKYEDSSGIARGKARLAQLENTERQLRTLRDQKLLQTE